MWVAGYPLAGTRLAAGVPAADSPLSDHTIGRHRVLLRRDGQEVTLLIDGRLVPVTRTDDSSVDWLTIEPPVDETATLRDLVVRW
jgi:hypothetical protein